jgi:hypothetical protein
MARPIKPPVGTGERLQMDLADYGETWRFIRDRIQEAGDKKGSRQAAIKKAAKAFNIHYRTAERHYERLSKFDTPQGMNILASHALKSYAPAINEAMSIVRAALSPHEYQQLRDGNVGMDVVLQFAKDRLELIELRKRKKRK